MSDAPRVDAETTSAAAARLLASHPDASVAAMANFTGLYTDMPASVPVEGHEVVRRGRFYDLFEPAYRGAVFDAWRRVRQHGAGTVSVQLRAGGAAALYFLDTTDVHGVILAILVPGEAAPDELDEIGPDTPARSRFGRFWRDDLGRVIKMDAAAEQLLGCAPDDLLLQDAIPWIHPDHVELAHENWIETISSPGIPRRWRCRHRRGDGSYLWVEITNTNYLDDPENRHVLSEMMDISEEMAANERVREREELLQRLTESMPLGLVQTDADGRIVYTNSRLHKILGAPDAPTLAALFTTATADDRRRLAGAVDRVTSTGADVDLDVHFERGHLGHTRICQLTLRGLRDAEGLVSGVVITVEDVTEATVLRRELEQRANVDPLTGCHNRGATMTELERLLDHSPASYPGTGVVFIDLDQFKPINDALGHAAGDEVLVAAAGRLTGAAREGDLVGRLGGDEFLVICPDLAGGEALTAIAERFRDALCGPLVLADGERVDLAASIGHAWAANDGTSADQLVARADTAMYDAKRTRRTRQHDRKGRPTRAR